MKQPVAPFAGSRELIDHVRVSISLWSDDVRSLDSVRAMETAQSTASHMTGYATQDCLHKRRDAALITGGEGQA